MRLQLKFKGSYCSRSLDNGREWWWTLAEGTLTKLGIHVWDLNKLLVERAQSTSRPVWKQCYKVKYTDVKPRFITERNDLKFNHDSHDFYLFSRARQRNEQAGPGSEACRQPGPLNSRVHLDYESSCKEVYYWMQLVKHTFILFLSHSLFYNQAGTGPNSWDSWRES